MVQTARGARKIAASRIGVTVEQYEANLDAGLRWCSGHKRWCRASDFGSHHRGCLAWQREYNRAHYVKTGRVAPRQQPLPARDGDKKQARMRVNLHVRMGRWKRPNESPCTDCGHVWKPGERRHEFDHHLGYGSLHHEDVQVVCSMCHHKRASDRGEWTGKRRRNGRNDNNSVGREVV